jgi:MFS transporter, UMF1 family
VPLTIVSIASLGSSFVLLNSFLPLLAKNHPSIRGYPENTALPLQTTRPEIDTEWTIDGDSVEQHLLDDDQGPTMYSEIQPTKTSPVLKLSNQISAKGVGIGYIAAVFVQLISICIILFYSKFSTPTSSSTMPMRTVLFVVGLWWALFTVPTGLWLRRRPGPQLPLNSTNSWFVGLSYVMFAWVSLWKTIKVAVKLRQVVTYLLGWFLLSDGIATITGTAILFARTDLHLGTAAVAILSITATASGIAGAAVWPIIQRRFKLNSIQIILACICIFEVIPLYSLLGFLPFIKSLGVGGLQQWWEIYPLAIILGFVMGGISSYSRSVFGLLIPPGIEAAFYTLYAVTDKGSSVIGPAIVGRIIDHTGQIRMGFWFLSVLMIAPAPFFYFVDVEKGRKDALNVAKRDFHIVVERRRED